MKLLAALFSLNLILGVSAMADTDSGITHFKIPGYAENITVSTSSIKMITPVPLAGGEIVTGYAKLAESLNIDTTTLKLFVPAGESVDLGENGTISGLSPRTASLVLPNFSATKIWDIHFYKSGKISDLSFGTLGNGLPKETTVVHTSRGDLTVRGSILLFETGDFRRVDPVGKQPLRLKNGQQVTVNLYLEFSEPEVISTLFVTSGTLYAACANGRGQAFSSPARYSLNADDSINRMYLDYDVRWGNQNGDYWWRASFAESRECKLMSYDWVTLFPSPATYHGMRILAPTGHAPEAHDICKDYGYEWSWITSSSDSKVALPADEMLYDMKSGMGVQYHQGDTVNLVHKFSCTVYGTSIDF